MIHKQPSLKNLLGVGQKDGGVVLAKMQVLGPNLRATE